VAYTQNPADTIDFSPWVTSGATGGNFGSDAHGRLGNLWIKGDGETDSPHVGFGAHGNWFVTFDLDDIRTAHLSGTASDLQLTGRFGTHGGIESTVATDGVVQGAVFLDGVRIDTMPEVAHNVPTPGGADTPSVPFDLSVPSGGRFLTLAILNGAVNSVWDDGVFRDVELSVVVAPPQPLPDPGQLPGLPAGLISYWDFDEAAGPVEGHTLDFAYDRQDGNDGSFQGGATRTAGLVGLGAAQFGNAGGMGVNVGPGTAGNFSVTDGITVEALIDSDWDGAAGNYDEIFRKEDGNPRILLAFQNDPHSTPPNIPVLGFGLMVGGVYSELDMPLDGLDGRPTLAEITTGMHHVVATYDSVSGEKAIWIDGQKVFSTVLSGPITSGGPTSAMIGNSAPGGPEPFTGVIDEVAVWSRALDAAEIGAHYGNVLAGNNYFVPEPATWLLALIALTCLPGRRWRRRAAAA